LTRKKRHFAYYALLVVHTSKNIAAAAFPR